MSCLSVVPRLSPRFPLLWGTMLISFYSAVRAGVYVDQEYVVLQDVIPGQNINLAQRLPKIKNTGSTPQKFSASVEPADKLKKGYVALPDIGWFNPPKVEMTIPPGAELTIEGMTLSIPEGYGNLHYEAILTVSQESAVTMSVAIPLWIETAGSKSNAVPDGDYGFGPSTIELGKAKTQSTFLINGTTVPQAFTVFLALPAKGSKSTYLPQSPGFEWMDDEKLFDLRIPGQKPISRNRYELTLKPGKKAAVKVSLNAKPAGQNREAFLVAVQNTTGQWRLCRIKTSLLLMEDR